MNMMNEIENTNVNDQKENPQDINIEHFSKFFWIDKIKIIGWYWIIFLKIESRQLEIKWK
jgi:hypothetical protein